MSAQSTFRPQKSGYSIKQAAQFLGVSERTVRNLIQRKLLRASKVLRVIRILGEDVETLFERTC